jgi:hypothetical protein
MPDISNQPNTSQPSGVAVSGALSQALPGHAQSAASAPQQDTQPSKHTFKGLIKEEEISGVQHQVAESKIEEVKNHAAKWGVWPGQYATALHATPGATSAAIGWPQEGVAVPGPENQREGAPNIRREKPDPEGVRERPKQDPIERERSPKEVIDQLQRFIDREVQRLRENPENTNTEPKVPGDREDPGPVRHRPHAPRRSTERKHRDPERRREAEKAEDKPSQPAPEKNINQPQPHPDRDQGTLPVSPDGASTVHAPQASPKDPAIQPTQNQGLPDAVQQVLAREIAQEAARVVERVLENSGASVDHTERQMLHKQAEHEIRQVLAEDVTLRRELQTAAVHEVQAAPAVQSSLLNAALDAALSGRALTPEAERIIQQSMQEARQESAIPEVGKQIQVLKESLAGKIGTALKDQVKALLHSLGNIAAAILLLPSELQNWIKGLFAEAQTADLAAAAQKKEDERYEGFCSIAALHNVSGVKTIRVYCGMTDLGGGLGYGDTSGSVVVRAGTHNLVVYNDSDGSVLFSCVSSLERERSYTLHVDGSIDGAISAAVW